MNLNIAKESMQKFATLVDQKVQEAMRTKMADYQSLKAENQQQRLLIASLESAKLKAEEKLQDLQK